MNAIEHAFTAMLVSVLLLAGCGSKSASEDTGKTPESGSKTSLSTDGSGQKEKLNSPDAGGEEVAPKPGHPEKGADPAPPPPGAIPPAIDLHIDEKGRARILPADLSGTALPEAEILECKVIDWRTALEAVMAACAKAPRRHVPVKEPGSPPRKKFPIRLILRWNSSIGKCKVYVGQVLCNYDAEGLARAKSKVQAILSTGDVDTCEIDPGRDVPVRMVLDTILMARETGIKVENTTFTGQVDPLGQETDPSLEKLERKKFYGSDESGPYFPEVRFLLRVSPQAGWRWVQFLLQECVMCGITELSLSGKEGERIPIVFPTDAGAEEPVDEGIEEDD